MTECVVIDGTVTAGGVMYRIGTTVELSESDAQRLEKMGVVSICKQEEPVIPVETVPEVTTQQPAEEKPKSKRGRRRK